MKNRNRRTFFRDFEWAGGWISSLTFLCGSLRYAWCPLSHPTSSAIIIIIIIACWFLVRRRQKECWSLKSRQNVIFLCGELRVWSSESNMILRPLRLLSSPHVSLCWWHHFVCSCLYCFARLFAFLLLLDGSSFLLLLFFISLHSSWTHTAQASCFFVFAFFLSQDTFFHLLHSPRLLHDDVYFIEIRLLH